MLILIKYYIISIFNLSCLLIFSDFASNIEQVCISLRSHELIISISLAWSCKILLCHWMHFIISIWTHLNIPEASLVFPNVWFTVFISHPDNNIAKDFFHVKEHVFITGKCFDEEISRLHDGWATISNGLLNSLLTNVLNSKYNQFFLFIRKASYHFI